MTTTTESVSAAWLAELRKQKQWAEHAAGQVPDDKLHATIATISQTSQNNTSSGAGGGDYPWNGSEHYDESYDDEYDETTWMTKTSPSRRPRSTITVLRFSLVLRKQLSRHRRSP